MAILKNYELDRLFEKHHVSESGKKLVYKIRSSPPSRRVSSMGRNVCVRYPSKKMGVVIQAESHTLELPCIYELEYDENVYEYYDQPLSLKLNYKNVSGRKVGITHTPDFFVIAENYIGFIGCKTEQTLLTLSQKAPERYCQLGQTTWSCPPANKALEHLGLSYRVWPDSKINWTHYQNMVFLEDYMRDSALTMDEKDIKLALRIVREQKILSLHDLLSYDGINPDTIYWLIAHQQIYCELRNDRVSKHLTTHVSIDAEHLEAYKACLDSVTDKSTYTHSVVNIVPGEHITWDSVDWKIVNLGDSHVYIESEAGEVVSIATSAFNRLAEKEEIKPNVNNINLQNEATITRLVKAASSEDLKEASYRMGVILPVIKNSKKVEELEGHPVRTLYRWIKAYKLADQDFGQGYLGLIPRRKPGNRTPRLPTETYEEMLNIIQKEYENNKHISPIIAYGHLINSCKKKNIYLPSLKTFSNAIHLRPKYNQVKSQMGQRAASQLEPFVWRLERDTPRHGERPFELVHIDHTELDIELLSYPERKNLGRPWLTILIDAFSRRILAMYLTFSCPSYISCMMVVQELVRRHNRLPNTIIVDRGSEFESIAFESFVGTAEITKKSRPPAKSRYGSVCERMFGTTNTEFIHNLQGNTKITKEVRLTTKSVDPKRTSTWTLHDLDNRLREYLYEVYDTIEHPALHESPRKTFEQSLALYGQRSHRVIPYTEEFRIRTLPPTKRGQAKVNVTSGVQVNYIKYWHESFREPEVAGTKVNVKYDPSDAGVVYAYVKNCWVECKSEYFSFFHGRTRKEIAIATAELTKKKQLSNSRRELNASRIANFISAAEDQIKAGVLQEDSRSNNKEDSDAKQTNKQDQLDSFGIDMGTFRYMEDF